MERLLVRPTEAAESLGLSRTTLYMLLANGELDSIKIGAARLIPVDALQRFIAARRSSADSPGLTPLT
jgi:excisionase family DNA binding protein